MTVLWRGRPDGRTGAGGVALLVGAAGLVVLAGWLVARPVRVGPLRVSCGSAVAVGLHRDAALTSTDVFGPVLPPPRFRAPSHVICWQTAESSVLQGVAAAVLAAVLVCVWLLARRDASPAHDRSGSTPSGATTLRARVAELDPMWWWIFAGTVLLVVGVAGRSVRAGVEWHYHRTLELMPFLAAAALIAGLLVFHRMAVELIATFERTIIVLTAIGGSMVQALVFNTGARSLTAWVGGSDFKRIALTYRPRYFLRHYPHLVRSLPIHQRSNMPGKVVFFQVLTRLTTSTFALTLILLLLHSLGGILIYVLGRRLLLSRRSAFAALILYFFIPARSSFLASLNTVAASIGIGLLLLAVMYRATRRPALLVALGVAVYLTALFDPSPLLLLPVGVAVFIVAPSPSPLTRRDVFQIAALPLIGFVSIHVVMTRVYRFDVFEALRRVSQDARRFNGFYRPDYTEWLVPNVREFFINAGYGSSLVVIALAVELLTLATCRWLRTRSQRERGRDVSCVELPVGVKVLAIGLVAEVVALDVAGFNRGEVSRLWLYVAVLMPLVVGSLVHRRSDRGVFHITLASSVIQTVLVLRMVGFDNLGYGDVGSRPLLHEWTWLLDVFAVALWFSVARRAVRAFRGVDVGDTAGGRRVSAPPNPT